jgi:hypothetical protein
MKKLQLRRETVRSLQDAALQNVVGGSTSDSVNSCDSTWASACGGYSATCVPTDRCETGRICFTTWRLE